MSVPTYEFTPGQNIVLGHLASRMKIVGRVLMALALLAMAQSFLSPDSGSAIGLEVGIVIGLLGLWSARAGAAFSKVATTQGADVSYLMRALGDISKLYDLQFWIFLGLAVLLGVTLLVAMTGWAPFPTAW